VEEARYLLLFQICGYITRLKNRRKCTVFIPITTAIKSMAIKRVKTVLNGLKVSVFAKFVAEPPENLEPLWKIYFSSSKKQQRPSCY
jgi:hypothetical protein